MPEDPFQGLSGSSPRLHDPLMHAARLPPSNTATRPDQNVSSPPQEMTNAAQENSACDAQRSTTARSHVHYPWPPETTHRPRAMRLMPGPPGPGSAADVQSAVQLSSGEPVNCPCS